MQSSKNGKGVENDSKYMYAYLHVQIPEANVKRYLSTWLGEDEREKIMVYQIKLSAIR